MNYRPGWRSTREVRVTWLIKNKNLWEGQNLKSLAPLIPIARSMRQEGLYSENTNLSDIVNTLGDLIHESINLVGGTNVQY